MKQAFVIVHFLDDPDSPSLVHISCGVAGYRTLCGLDGGLAGDEMSSVDAPKGAKISCQRCFEIWESAKDVTASDFTRGAAS